MSSEPDLAPETLFRPVKRRKFMRKRLDDNDTDSPSHESVAGSSGQHSRPQEIQADYEEEGQSTGVARLRRPHPARKGGIAFSTKSQLGKDDNQSMALTPAKDTEQERIQAMCDRFTGHTGQTVDVDKHMYGSSWR